MTKSMSERIAKLKIDANYVNSYGQAVMCIAKALEIIEELQSNFDCEEARNWSATESWRESL